jgi:hypothetical protein
MECAAKGLAAEPCAGGVADRRCGGCGAVAYCSRVHQVGHTIYTTLAFDIQEGFGGEEVGTDDLWNWSCSWILEIRRG